MQIKDQWLKLATHHILFPLIGTTKISDWRAEGLKNICRYFVKRQESTIVCTSFCVTTINKEQGIHLETSLFTLQFMQRNRLTFNCFFVPKNTN